MRAAVPTIFALLLLASCSGREHPAPSSAPPAPSPRATAKMVQPEQAAAPSASAQANASPVEAAEPAYDLAADQRRRIEAAKSELGPKTVTAIVSDVFVVVGPKGWQGRAFDDSVSLMRSAMGGFLNHRFSKKPARAISVYLFPDNATYEAFCAKKFDAPCIAGFGFYTPGERYMVMNAGRGLGTLTHELVHPLVEADFPDAPTWINEGIASVFEQPQIPRPGEIHGGKNWRHPRLRRALTTSERDDARLDRLFGMPDATFRGDKEDLNYATARYVCQWLDEKGKLWPFFQKWKDDVQNDPTGEKSFREVVGMTPVEAHAVWSKWVLAL